MPSRNTQRTRQAEADTLNSLPLRFPHPGEPVTLGEKEYHLAVLTTAGARELQRFVDSAAIPVINASPTDSIGLALVNGSLAYEKFETLHGLLERSIFEAVGKDIVYESSPQQIAAAIDALLSQSGLEWLQRIIKNSIAAMGSEIMKLLDRELTERTAKVAAKLEELRQQDASENENLNIGTMNQSIPSASSS